MPLLMLSSSSCTDLVTGSQTKVELLFVDRCKPDTSECAYDLPYAAAITFLGGPIKREALGNLWWLSNNPEVATFASGEWCWLPW